MNKLFYFLFITAVLVVGACGSDDSCASEDFVGTWAGTQDCDPTLPPTLTLEVTSSGDNQITIIQDGDTFPVNIVGCDIERTEFTIDFFGVMITTIVEGSLDGDTFNYSLVVEAAGVSQECRLSLTRQ